jgi:enterochelin esterase-like enzyme
MKKPRLIALLLSLTLFCVFASAAPAAAQKEDRRIAPAIAGDIVTLENQNSTFVTPRTISVWLPPGYARERNAKRRYPVIYMQDGQNLFLPGNAFGGQEWGVDEAMIRLMLGGQARGAIIVGVHNGPGRYQDYMPQKWFAAMSDSLRGRIVKSQNGYPASDNYLRFLVEELKPVIDKRFRTMPGKKDTSIMGSSMGGLIAIYAMGEYPQVFGQAAALSVHWPMLGAGENGEGRSLATDYDVDDVAISLGRWLKTSKLKPKSGNRLYIDHGTETLDAFYGPYRQAVESRLMKDGWKPPMFESRVYAGAAHDEASWRARVEVPLAFLLGPPTGK